jgi:hypothetical protein
MPTTPARLPLRLDALAVLLFVLGAIALALGLASIATDTRPGKPFASVCLVLAPFLLGAAAFLRWAGQDDRAIARRIVASPYCVWSYPASQWRAYRRRDARTGGLAWTLLFPLSFCAAMVLCGFFAGLEAPAYLARWPQALFWAGLIGAGCVVIVWYLTGSTLGFGPWRPRVAIAAQAVYIDGEVWPFAEVGHQLLASDYEHGPPPRLVLRYLKTHSTEDDTYTTEETLRLPIPVGEDHAARQIGARLRQALAP